MAAITSGYSKNQPSGSSSIRDGDDMLRSDKSILEAALNDEHYFTPQTSASSASGGIHRKGSARVFTGTRASLATPSSADSDGRLYYATDTESLHIIQTSSHSTIYGGSQPFGARAYSATTSHSGSETTLAVIMATEDFDVGGFFSAGSHAMTVPSGASGRYLVIAQINFPSPHTGTARRIALTRAGTTNTLITASALTSTATAPITVNLSYIANAVGGDTFGLRAWQDSGGALSLDSVFLMVQKF